MNPLNKLTPIFIYYTETPYKIHEMEVLVEFQVLYEARIVVYWSFSYGILSQMQLVTVTDYTLLRRDLFVPWEIQCTF